VILSNLKGRQHHLTYDQKVPKNSSGICTFSSARIRFGDSPGGVGRSPVLDNIDELTATLAMDARRSNGPVIWLGIVTRRSPRSEIPESFKI
jgi:hypothetical protein